MRRFSNLKLHSHVLRSRVLDQPCSTSSPIKCQLYNTHMCVYRLPPVQITACAGVRHIWNNIRLGRRPKRRRCQDGASPESVSLSRASWSSSLIASTAHSSRPLLSLARRPYMIPLTTNIAFSPRRQQSCWHAFYRCAVVAARHLPPAQSGLPSLLPAAVASGCFSRDPQDPQQSTDCDSDILASHTQAQCLLRHDMIATRRQEQ